AIIALDTQKERRPIAIDVAAAAISSAASVEQIVSVRQDFRVRVGGQEIETVGELLFHLGLQAVVVAVSFRRSVARIPTEALERNKVIGIGVGREELAYRIGSVREDFQMASQRVHVAD